MHPLIHLGPFRSAWSLLFVIACAISLPISLYEARRRDIPARLILRLWPCVMLGGMLGAHVYYLLTHPYYLAADAHGKIFNLMSGMSLQGSIIGGVGVAYLMLRLIDEPLLPVLDIMSPAGALGIGIGKIGCLAMGCCYGKPTDLPFGIVFDNPMSIAPHGIRLHPAQIYEGLPCLVLAGFLHGRLKKKTGPGGSVFALYLLGYGLIRFFAQFFRDDDAGRLLWGMAHGQYMAIAMSAAALLLMSRLKAGHGGLEN